MSDADDLARSHARAREAAASAMVHADRLGAELAKLERELASVPEGDGPAAELRAELERRLAARRGDHALALEAADEAKAAMGEIEKAARDLPAAAARRTIYDAPDPFEPSPEMAALDNVRRHAAELDAQASPGRELAGAARAPAPVIDKDAEARRILAEMKAARAAKAAGAAGEARPSEARPSEASPSEASRKKGGGRTM